MERYKYLSLIKTSDKNLFGMSSKITGELPQGFNASIGNLLFKLLPAGSISGAPKKKTVEIIQAAEGQNRGYYTGVAGYFDGDNLDSCVLIRYLEKHAKGLRYFSGGGITFQSQNEKEYQELIDKVYVPIV